MSRAVTWLLLSTVDWKENKNISMSEKPNQSVIGWLNMSSRPILTPLVRTREYFVKIIQFLGWSQPGEGAEDCVDHRTEAGNWSRKVGLGWRFTSSLRCVSRLGPWSVLLVVDDRRSDPPLYYLCLDIISIQTCQHLQIGPITLPSVVSSSSPVLGRSTFTGGFSFLCSG